MLSFRKYSHLAIHQNIAAVQMRFGFLKSDRFQQLFQFRHIYFIPSADIETLKQQNGSHNDLFLLSLQSQCTAKTADAVAGIGAVTEDEPPVLSDASVFPPSNRDKSIVSTSSNCHSRCSF